jgi:transcriptional regulator with XRE-family HTH domain
MQIHPLRVARELRGWSQNRLADQVGVSVRTVMRWEQGQSVPYPYYRERLCTLFESEANSLGLLPYQDSTPATHVAGAAAFVRAHVHDYASLEQELANVEAGLEITWTAASEQSEHDRKVVVETILHLMDFHRVHGVYSMAESWLQRGLQWAEDLGDQMAVMHILEHLSDAMYAQSKGEQAEQYGQQALSLAQELGQVSVECDLQANLHTRRPDAGTVGGASYAD